MTMQQMAPNSPRRKATNLTVDAELLQQAKAFGIPLSQTFEAALALRVAEERRRRWQETHRAAIEAYNERIEGDGLWSDGRRLF